MLEHDRAATRPCVIYLIGSHFGSICVRPVRTGGRIGIRHASGRRGHGRSSQEVSDHYAALGCLARAQDTSLLPLQGRADPARQSPQPEASPPPAAHQQDVEPPPLPVQVPLGTPHAPHWASYVGRFETRPVGSRHAMPSVSLRNSSCSLALAAIRPSLARPAGPRCGP